MRKLIYTIMGHTDFLWNEFIYGGHWLSIGAAAIVLSIMLFLDISIRWELLLLSYLLIQCIYNYNHFKELEIDLLSASPRVEHLLKYKGLIPYITATYGIFFLAFLLILGNINSFFVGFFLLFLGLLFTKGGKKLTGKVVGLKSIYVSLSWALLIPFVVIYSSSKINFAVFLVFVFIFLRAMLNTNFFDIKDVIADKKENINTFTLKFGKKGSLKILHFINLISFIPIITGVLSNTLPVYSLFIIIFVLYSSLYLFLAENAPDISNLTFIIVDGEYYFWPFLLLLGMITIN
jgi:4-hydroxybenzoate polyprenyltransferase